MTCPWCDRLAKPETICPWSIRCPECGMNPGVRCRRPSGHSAADMHVKRYRLVEGPALTAVKRSQAASAPATASLF